MPCTVAKLLKATAKCRVFCNIGGNSPYRGTDIS